MARTWSRPYPPGKGRWVVAVWELVALAFLRRTTVDLFGLDARASLVLGVVLVVLWVLLCWRLARLGLYVGEPGLRIQGLVTARTIGWAEVDRIVIETAVSRLWRFRIPAGRTIRVRLTDGERVNSTLWADGVDFKFRPALFHLVHADLRCRHESARARLARAVGSTG